PEQLSIYRLVANITGIKLQDAEMTLITAWLGLDRNEGRTDHAELPTLGDAAEAAASTRATAQQTVERAVEKWSRNAWMTILRDEIADFVQRREGTVTVEELAARLLGLRGSVSEGPRRMILSTAVIQAALEAEATRESARVITYRGARAALVI